MEQSNNADDQVDSTGNDGVPSNGGGDESIVDLAQQPIVKQWTKFVTILFAFAGVGAGLTVILRDVVDQPIIDSNTAGALTFPGVDLPIVAAIVAVFIGVYLGWNLQTDDQTAYLAGAISVFAGTTVSILLFVIFYSVATDLSIDFGGLIVSSIVSGLGVSVAAAGGAWASRNTAPETTESQQTVESQHGAQTSD
ncbi:hypothetical protein [Halostagnicola sp. A-GB9-2]|uniref:hypothetical protein n=1 Tax=Halostagnicola sp. A-GB9-2 TaxID=3048066 RepID=UPI0024BFF8B8|nr:hypothetical protein [Halostagnicola sp. A-GB9-2]MDJ1432416.1 hypothetical protein [Halostagnicola sp. A-GB9-2]